MRETLTRLGQRQAGVDAGTRSADAVDEIERAMVSVQIEQALAQVSDRRRTVLVEVHLRGRPVAEVDAELGAPPGRVHRRLYYSLRALGVLLEEGGWRDGR